MDHVNSREIWYLPLKLHDKRNKAEIVELSFLNGWEEGETEQLACCSRLFKILPLFSMGPTEK